MEEMNGTIRLTDLWRIKLLFKIKIQPENSSSGHGGDEQHNTDVDEQIHSGDVKIVDLVREHL
jgi:hypothetical protein